MTKAELKVEIIAVQNKICDILDGDFPRDQRLDVYESLYQALGKLEQGLIFLQLTCDLKIVEDIGD